MIKVFTSLWRVKAMAGKYKLNSLLSLSVLSLCALMLSSCSNDDSKADTSALDAARLTIVGSSSAAPEQTQTYTVVGDGVEGVSWSIASGPASAAADGNTADVTFSGTGTVLIQASSNGVEGFFEVNVSVGDLSWEVAYDEASGYANEGGSSVATITFNYPVASIEGASLASDIGSVALAGSGTEWTATFTGGAAKRDSSDLVLTNVTTTAEYAALVVEEAVIAAAFHVDNQPSAYLTDVSWEATATGSDGSVKDSTEVTITWTFSEGVRGALVPDDVYDSDVNTGGFQADADTDPDDKNGVADMEMWIDDLSEEANIGDSSYVALDATDDPAVWTYTWTVNGDTLRAETTHWDGDDFWDGEGTVQFDLELEGVVDLAGNALADNNAGSSTTVFVNEDPDTDVMNATADVDDVDPGSGIVDVDVSGSGSDDDVLWLFVANGTTPPTSYDELTESGDATFVSNPGIYDIYVGEYMDNGEAPVDSDGNVIFFKINNFVVAADADDD